MVLVRISIVVAGLLPLAACAASPRHPFPHQPFFVNQVGSSVELRVTWVLRKVDCSTTPEALAQTLDPSDLDDPRSYELAAQRVAVLDGIPRAGASPVGTCEPQSSVGASGADKCVAAILEAGSAHPVLMVAVPRWLEAASGSMFSCRPQVDPVSPCHPTFGLADRPGPDSVALVRSGKGLLFVGTRGPWPETDGGAQGLPNVRLADVDPAAISARPSRATTSTQVDGGPGPDAAGVSDDAGAGR